MSYQITIEEKPGYLHIRVTGQNSPEAVRGYFADIYAACRQRQCPVVLIEEDLKGPGLSVVEMFEIVGEGVKQTWPHVRRIAYVDVNPEHSQERQEFATTVAANRGVNVCPFATVSAAEKWLRETSESGQTG